MVSYITTEDMQIPQRRSGYFRLGRAILGLTLLPVVYCAFPFLRAWKGHKAHHDRRHPEPPPGEFPSYEPPDYEPLRIRSGRNFDQSQSRLLCLPSELRLLIWECIIVRKSIALYTRKGKIEYADLTAYNMQQVKNIHPALYQQLEDARSIPRQTQSRISLLAVLQTCKTIYLETIELLYQANTFVCLQNYALSHFCNTTLSTHLSKIRSLHIHYHFRMPKEVITAIFERYQPPECWDGRSFDDNVIVEILRYLPNLKRLSFFLEGPISSYHPYFHIMSSLKRTRNELKFLDFMVARIPRPDLRNFDPHSQWVVDVLRLVEVYIATAANLFPVIQAPVEPGQSELDLADLDVGDDVGWRIGTMYLQSDMSSGVIGTLGYAVFVGDRGHNSQV